MKAMFATLALAVVIAGQAVAQEGPGPMAEPGQGPPPMMAPPEGGPAAPGGPGEGPWWKDPRVRQTLHLTEEQKQKIEKIDRDHQMQAIDLRAAVEKQDVALRTLLEADIVDNTQVLEAVDKLSQARAQLERSRMEMMLAIRHVLTADQTKRLRNLPGGGGRPRGPGGSEPPEGGPPGPPNGPAQ